MNRTGKQFRIKTKKNNKGGDNINPIRKLIRIKEKYNGLINSINSINSIKTIDPEQKFIFKILGNGGEYVYNEENNEFELKNGEDLYDKNLFHYLGKITFIQSGTATFVNLSNRINYPGVKSFISTLISIVYDDNISLLEGLKEDFKSIKMLPENIQNIRIEIAPENLVEYASNKNELLSGGRKKTIKRRKSKKSKTRKL